MGWLIQVIPQLCPVTHPLLSAVFTELHGLSCHLPIKACAHLLFLYVSKPAIIWLQRTSEPVIFPLWDLLIPGTKSCTRGYALPTILDFPSVLVTLNILQAEMPRREWQKDFAIPSHEFVVKRLFIRAWNMWKQNKVLKVKVTCSVKNWSEY